MTKARIETPSQVSLRRVAKRFLIIFLPLVILLGSILVVFYYQQAKNERTIIETEEVQHVSHQMDIVINDLQSIVSDLMFLSEQNELQEMLDSGEAGVRKALAKEWLSFSTHKGLYDQIRFLNETGMEVVRVNFNNSNPSIVPDDQLQSKAKRYYFEDTFVLRQGEVYVSPFDLNIENGEIEQPLKPMIRFGTPVFDSYGQKRGIVVLNYLGTNLLHDLEATPGGYGQSMLLNSDGFWLMGPTPEDEWGFMYEDKSDRTFGNDFTEAWQRISGGESGQFYNGDGMFTYTTICPLLEGQISRSTGSGRPVEPSTQRAEAKAYFWKTVSCIPSDVLNASTGAILDRLLPPYAVMVVLLAGGSWSVARTGARRKQAEEELQGSEERYRALIDLGTEVGEAVVMLQDTEQEEGVQTFVSDEWPRITGYSKEELLGMSFFDLVHPGDRQASIDRHRRRIAGESMPGLYELLIIRKDGTEVPVELTSAYTTYKGQRANVIYIRDITERKRMEEEIIQTRARAEALSVSEKMKTDLLSMVSHELRTPLASIKGFASTLLQPDVRWSEEEQRDFIQEIDRESDLLTRLVSDLLDMSYIDAGLLNLNKAEHKLDNVLESASNIMTKITENHKLEVKIPAELPPVLVDPGRIMQVLINLIENAVRFSAQGSQITIETRLTDDKVIITVADKGIGIPPELLNKIFDRFYQAKSIIVGAKNGTGLGLFICRGIVMAHGGRIWVRSKERYGSKFSFSLSISRDEIAITKAGESI